MSEEVEVFVKIGNRFFEGKLHLKTTGSPEFSSMSAASLFKPQVQDSKQPMQRPLFPEPYAEMVSVTDQGTYWHIKPRTFLQSADFAEIARIVKQYGGAYVSAGKSSHFRVPK